MLSFHAAVAENFARLNESVVSELRSDVPLVENVGHYIVEGGGKRLRPVSVLLCCAALDYRGAQQVQLATVIEFIHTATLLHDDVVDGSERRRGRATANAVWDNSTAVLVGDFLYSRAFQLLVRLGNMNIMQVLADTTNRIAEGEVQQLLNAGDPETSEASYLDVVLKKTAVLFEAATRCSGLLCGADAKVVEDLAMYGRHLGMAFQLQDDVLDYTGEAAALGKNIGDDLAEGKPTLPLIYTITNGSRKDSALVRQAICDKNPELIEGVVAAVTASGGLDYTQRLASEQVRLARERLTSLPLGPYRESLANLASFAVERNF